MGFQVSPGIQINEIDLTTIVPAISTTTGAFSGVFAWGPVEQRQLITAEQELVKYYGYPEDWNFESWFTCAAFLSYANSLIISRACSNNALNAIAGPTYTSSQTSNVFVKNLSDYLAQESTLSGGSTLWISKYPGAYGSSLKISICESANAFQNILYSSNANDTISIAFTVGSNVATLTCVDSSNSAAAANTTANTFIAGLTIGDYMLVGNTTIGKQYLKIDAISNCAAINSSAVTATINMHAFYTLPANSTVTCNTTVGLTRLWEYYNQFDRAPGTSVYTNKFHGSGDEMHIVIADGNGVFTGVKGEVLEIYPHLSRATDAVGTQGGTIYYAQYLNNGSEYVWWVEDHSGALSNTAANMTVSTNQTPLTMNFYGGVDSNSESTISVGDLARAVNLFTDPDEVDISIVMQGKATGYFYTQWANYLISNIAETRLDTVVTISPNLETVVNNAGIIADSLVTFRNNLQTTSYAMLDSGYAYKYDRYNDKYRWVPLNGDIAGLIAYTEQIRAAWWSPAGYNRGFLKNVIKLAYNPNKASRDQLYSNNINPVITQNGQGTLLFGDKTLLTKPSAFDRINVRRLFIVLEKSIAIAAKYSLFEFNDAFTRQQFVNMVTPYLKDVKGKRGITDFLVKCDETNNTPDIIDSNQFVADIYIKPARSINFITLNFVAVPTGVDFSEVEGNFGT